MGYAHVRRALHGDFDLVVTNTRAEALAALKEHAGDAILCSIHFDESRMWELLVAAKAIAPDVPFICCQILGSALRPAAVQSAVSIAESHGALGFINYNAVLRSQGTAEADKYLRAEVLRLLPPVAGCAAAGA